MVRIIMSNIFAHPETSTNYSLTHSRTSSNSFVEPLSSPIPTSSIEVERSKCKHATTVRVTAQSICDYDSPLASTGHTEPQYTYLVPPFNLPNAVLCWLYNSPPCWHGYPSDDTTGLRLELNQEVHSICQATSQVM